MTLIEKLIRDGTIKGETLEAAFAGCVFGLRDSTLVTYVGNGMVRNGLGQLVNTTASKVKSVKLVSVPTVPTVPTAPTAPASVRPKKSLFGV